MRRSRNAGVTVSGLRRALIYKPLAVLMCMLLLPAIPVVERAGVVAPARVEAQISSCAGAGTRIIRNYCSPDNRTLYLTALNWLEDEAVKAYLAQHNIPESEAYVVYEYGRSDVRTEVRTRIVAKLLAIMTKAASERSPEERDVHNWLQSWFHYHEINLLTKAVSHFQSLVNDPCRFTLDPTLASTHGITYDGTPFCGSSFSTFFGLPVPVVPAASYFRAYGFKNSYGALSATVPEYGKMLAQMTAGLSAAAGVATIASAVIAAVAGSQLAASYTAALATYISFGIKAGYAGTSTAFAVGGTTVKVIGTAGLVAGPVIIMLVAAAIGIAAGVQVFQYQDSINALNGLKAELATVTNTPPDLKAIATDTSKLGLYKLQNTVLSLTLPDVPSTKPLPAHRPGVDLAFSEEELGNTFNYQDWDGNVWTAQTWGNWLVQTCRNGATSTCPRTEAINAEIRFKERFHQQKWTASRFGSIFHNSSAIYFDPSGTLSCEADTTTGISPQQDYGKCPSYSTRFLEYTSGAGTGQRTALYEFTPPAFQGPYNLSFTAGVPSKQVIIATGNPKPTVDIQRPDGGTLTSNPDFTITFAHNTPFHNTVTVAFNGNPAALSQDYTLNLLGMAGINLPQTYTINVRDGLRITSPGTLSATAGKPVEFLVTTTGAPAPQLTIDPEALVDGLTFTDNGNGTATIAGMPVLPGEFSCIKADPSTGGSTRPCAIFATNAQGTVQQPFTINLASAPAASLGPPFTATFTAGIDNEVKLTSTGAETPVSWDFIPDPAAPWLTLVDNGTGSATLKGTPPPGTTGTFRPGAIPRALGSRGIAPLYTVNVISSVVFTSTNTATFTVGTADSFAVSANLGTISLSGVLPRGLSFSPGNPATISGVPAAGTAGQYAVSVKADAGGGETLTETLILNVNEAPQLTGGNTATMFVGMPGVFVVPASGFPSMSNDVVALDAPPPSSPDEGRGMYFIVTGLPPGLTASNRNPQGFETGTLTIQGTPSRAGTYPVTITAQNGVGAPAQQTLTIGVLTVTGVAPKSGTTCNGNYTGTFSGNIFVSRGQNCSFFSGGVNGSVTVLGGNFAVAKAKITGSVNVMGSAAFALGAGTTVLGNVSIVAVGSAATANQICGTRVEGNLAVAGNAVPMVIGAPQLSCWGNYFDKNVQILSNTAPIQVFDNDIGKNLACLGNSAITGGSNQAGKKTGQCAGF